MDSALPALGTAVADPHANEHATTRPALRYRPEIDGLRALAVLPVILFHGGIGPFGGGFVGVDVFFVISGYLIAGILAHELATGTFSFRGFYERRARRILPALIVVMAACVPLAFLWLMPGEFRRFGQSLVAASAMVSNLFFALDAGGYFSAHVEQQPLLHTWSLAVEEHFYLLFPLALYGLWRWGRRTVALVLGALAVASFVAAEAVTPHYPLIAFYTLPTRAWELAAGALLALVGTQALPVGRALREVGAALGLALIVYAVFAFDWTTPYPGRWTLLPVAGALLLLACATPATAVGAVLASRPLVGIGLISYSAYLWHQPLFAFARQRSLDAPGPGLMLGLAALSLILAVLTWRFVERPFRDRRRFTAQQIFRWSVWGSVTVLGMGLAIVLCRGYPERLPLSATNVFAAASIAQGEQNDPACNLDEDRYALIGCVHGTPDVPATVALVGDSHAAMLVRELGAAMAPRGLAFRQYTKNGCPVAFGFIKGGGDQNCRAFQDAYLAALADPAIRTVIVASRWPSYVAGKEYDNGEGGIGVDPRDPLTVAGVPIDAPVAQRHAAIRGAYTASIERLAAMGKRVIVIYPVPEQGWDIPLRIAKQFWFTGAVRHPAAVRTTSFRARTAAVTAALDAAQGPAIVRIHPADLLCDTLEPGRCASEQVGTLLYFDDTHLTPTAVRPLAARIVNAL